MTAATHDEPPPYDGPPPPDDDWDPQRAVSRASGTIDDLITPSHDPEAERQVIGAAMLDPWTYGAIHDSLTAGDFYDPRHEVIWRALGELAADGQPIDMVSVADRLTSTKQLRQAGGPAYLAGILSGLIAAGNAPHHAAIIRDHAHRRDFQRAAIRIGQLATIQTDNPAEIVTAATRELASVQQRYLADDVHHASTWQPVDLTTIDLDFTLEPTLICRTDGVGLVYAGAVHSFVGEPESAKSWVVQWGCAQEIKAGNDVVYYDFEDRPQRVVRRMLEMGCTRDAIHRHFRYVRPDVALTSIDIGNLEAAAEGTTLAVIDGITEAMTMQGLSLSDNEDIARFLALMPRRLADIGPAVCQVDHVVKDAESRGRYAIGGQHKLAGIDGAQFKMIVTEPFGKGKRGRANVIIDKDREGGVRQNAIGIQIAELILDSTPRPDSGDSVGALRVYLDPPDTSAVGPAGEFRPTHLMQACSELIHTVPGIGSRGILDQVEGKADTIRKALRALQNEGFIRIEKGKGNSVSHYPITPFEDKW